MKIYNVINEFGLLEVATEDISLARFAADYCDGTIEEVEMPEEKWYGEI